MWFVKSEQHQIHGDWVHSSSSTLIMLFWVLLNMVIISMSAGLGPFSFNDVDSSLKGKIHLKINSRFFFVLSNQKKDNAEKSHAVLDRYLRLSWTFHGIQRRAAVAFGVCVESKAKISWFHWLCFSPMMNDRRLVWTWTHCLHPAASLLGTAS